MPLHYARISERLSLLATSVMNSESRCLDDMYGLYLSSPICHTKEREILTSSGNDSSRYSQNAGGDDGYDQTC